MFVVTEYPRVKWIIYKSKLTKKTLLSADNKAKSCWYYYSATRNKYKYKGWNNYFERHPYLLYDLSIVNIHFSSTSSSNNMSLKNPNKQWFIYIYFRQAYVRYAFGDLFFLFFIFVNVFESTCLSYPLLD